MLLSSMIAQHHNSPKVSLTLLVTTEIESREAVVTDGQLLRGRVCGRLQDGDTIVLLNVLSANEPHTTPGSHILSKLADRCRNPAPPESKLVASGIDHQRTRSSLPKNTNAQLTFNMCSSVVLPALSRPRNRSLACLLRRPSEAKMS